MIELGERLCLAREPLGKRRRHADAARQNLDRDEAVEFLLSRLVHCAHAAFADEFENFQLREKPAEFRRRRRYEFGGRFGAGVHRALLEQAGGAESV